MGLTGVVLGVLLCVRPELAIVEVVENGYVSVSPQLVTWDKLWPAKIQ